MTFTNAPTQAGQYNTGNGQQPRPKIASDLARERQAPDATSFAAELEAMRSRMNREDLQLTEIGVQAARQIGMMAFVSSLVDQVAAERDELLIKAASLAPQIAPPPMPRQLHGTSPWPNSGRENAFDPTDEDLYEMPQYLNGLRGRV